jgi:ATP-binding cassette, subfamily B, bacterial PglK
VKETIKLALDFMTPSERRRYFALVIGRSMASLLDLVGVLAIGFLAASVALFVANGSDPSRRQYFLGFDFPSLNISVLPLYVAVTLLIFILKAVISASFTRLLATFIAKIEARASRHVASVILGKDLESVSKVSREWIYYLCTRGVSAPFTEVLNYLATIVSEGSLFLILTATFLVVDPASTLAVLAFFSLVGFAINSLVGKRLAQVTRRVTEGLMSTQTIVSDVTVAFRELIVAGKREDYFDRLENTRLKVASNIGSQLFYTALPRFVLEAAVLLGVFAFGAVKMLSGDLTSSISTIGVFLTGSFRIMAAMLPWQTALIGIKQSSAQALDVAPYLREDMPARPKYVDSQRWKENPRSSGFDVEVRNLTFSYPDSQEFAIGPISFDIPKGAQVAFIGKSGSGKSTIADLLGGLRLPKSGQILLSKQTPESILERAPGAIAFVPQRPGLVTGSVLENILLDVPVAEFDNRRLNRALKDSLFDEVVALLPDGLSTKLSEKDPKISGGQLQRLGLARALYAQADILILDEATSALDGESEFLISKVLENLRGKVTVVLIAHRLHTVQSADTVFLISNGEILDQGKLSELVHRNKSISDIVDYMAISSQGTLGA